MDQLLRLRQLRLWEAVCAQYAIPAAKYKKVAAWIQEGTLHEHL